MEEGDLMNIGSIIQNDRYRTIENSTKVSPETKYAEKYKYSSKQKDVVEISSEAYKMQEKAEQLSATSGKDTLGITKGSKDNTYIIHFSDSAMVSRAISRGYITVNGVNIALPDETKKQLSEIDQKAEADRMKAYNEYIIQHERAVAQQQSDAWKNAASDASRAFEIAAKLSGGGKITSTEAKELMKFNPQLYAMAMSTATMEKQSDKQESIHRNENKADNEKVVPGVEWSQFEWKRYESQMTVSLKDGAEIQGVSEGEIL